MTSRRGFLGFIASLPFVGYVSDYVPVILTKRIFGGNPHISFAKCGTKKSRNKLKDLYCSPEAMEDIRNWSIYQKDEVTRREIYCGIPKE